MLDVPEYIQFFGGLVAIVNPLGVLPIFISLTQGRTEAHIHRTGLIAAFSAAIILLVCLFGGHWILKFFGIHIDSFRVAGGLLILLAALAMLITTLGDTERKQDEKDQAADHKTSVAVVPLALPLLAGPGAISTVILHAHAHHSVSHLLITSSVIIIVSILILIVFRMAPMLNRLLGQTGLHVATKVMGLILASLAVEYLTMGLKGIFPLLR
jgi:multiple antibiotic resistance protein